jgi:methionyl-tRNA formyltransferase
LSLKAVFMGKNKRSAARALAYLVERGVDVRGVVAAEPDELTTDEQRLDLVAEKGGLPLTGDEDLYAAAQRGELSDVDLIVSFLFWKRIREPLISLPRVGCLNFHPAPLPDIRGVGGYNVAILEDLPEWGVSAHFVDEDIDTGDLVAVERFPIDRNAETAFSLDVKSQERLFELFRSVVDRLLAGEELPRTPQGDGRYFTREDVEELRRVRTGDDLPRKIRAFWYPPHPGATIELDGGVATLVESALLGQVAEVYRRAGEVP